MKAITPLGKKWELRHSLWLIPLLFVSQYGYIVFIVFFYIGIRANKKTWIYSGIVYFLIEIAFFIFVWQNIQGNMNRLFMHWVNYGFIFSYLTAWVQAIWVRKEYLEIIAQKEIAKNPDIIKQHKQENKTLAKSGPSHNNKPSEPIDINIASKQDLAMITGSELANRIVKAREQNGYFISFIDIIRYVSIKPHQLNHLKKHFVIGEQYITSSESTTSKRRGRMVDY